MLGWSVILNVELRNVVTTFWCNLIDRCCFVCHGENYSFRKLIGLNLDIYDIAMVVVVYSLICLLVSSALGRLLACMAAIVVGIALNAICCDFETDPGSQPWEWLH